MAKRQTKPKTPATVRARVKASIGSFHAYLDDGSAVVWQSRHDVREIPAKKFKGWAAFLEEAHEDD